MQINRKLVIDVISKHIKYFKDKKKFFIILGIIAIIFIGYTIYTKYTLANPNLSYTTLRPEYRSLKKSITVSGEVKAGSEIELAPEVSGRLTKIYVSIGQSVKTGQLITQIENRAQQAQLTQALGALKSAQAQLASSRAQLEKLTNGATAEDKNIAITQLSSAQTALKSAEDTARNILQTAYAGTVSAILFGTDVALDDPTTSTPKLKFNTVENTTRLKIENTRVEIGDIVKRHKTASTQDLSGEALLNELNRTRLELLKMQRFADDLLLALSGATSDTSSINSYTSTITGARTQILSNISAITSAKNAIATAQKALATAKENKNKVFTGTRSEDIDVAIAGVEAAEAALLSAKGNYQAAKTALDKTFIKSPQSGVIADIYKDAGEFVQASVPIIKITSDDTYVSALVSEVDITKVRKDMPVLVKLDAIPNQVFNGVIDFIYPDKIEKMGIIYYELRVLVPEFRVTDITILPGMSLDVIIPYEKKENILSIERAATKKDANGKYYVQIINPNKNKPIDEKFSKLYFEHGFIGDEFIEILDGLNEQTQIIDFITEN